MARLTTKPPWPAELLQGYNEIFESITGKQCNLFSITRIIDNLWSKFINQGQDDEPDDDIIKKWNSVIKGHFGLAVGKDISEPYKEHGFPTIPPSLAFDLDESGYVSWEKPEDNIPKIIHNLFIVFCLAVNADPCFVESVLNDDFEIVVTA